MKKRLVLTIDETNEGKHGITLDDDDMCYGIKFDLDIRYIEKMNAIGIARYMIEVLNNNPISVSCSASRLKEEIKPCVDKILEAEPLISAEWLLRGKGEMLIASSPNEKKEEEAHAESLFRNVLVEFMSMVNKRLKSIDNNTQSSVDKLEGITDLLTELRKTA